MRIVKWIAIGAAALAAALGLGALVLLFVVDPNHFKDDIEAAVSDAVGRDFRLAGDIDLSFFPLLGLETGAGQLANPPGFPAQPLARWRAASLGAQLLPLIRGRLIVDDVRIEGLELALLRNAAGDGNWEGLVTQDAEVGRGATLESLAGIRLRDARILYVDEHRGRRIEVSALNLDLGAWRPGALTALEAQGAIHIDGRKSRVPVSLQVAGRFGAQAIEVPELTVRVGASTLKAAARLRSLAAGDGTLALQTPSLRDLLTQVGVAAPKTRDPQAMGAFSAETSWRLSKDALVLEPLALRLDETQMRGRVEVPLDDAGVTRFALQGDRVRLGRYFEPSDVKGDPLTLPTATLAALRVEGELSLASAELDDVHLKGARLRLARGDP